MAASHNKNSMSMTMVMLLWAVVMSFASVSAQAAQQASCAAQLVPCANYLNATNPPDACCGPLKQALTNDLTCLCSLYESPTILKALNIDLNSALSLPKRCGLTSFSSTNACSNSTAGAPSSTAPPATPGGNNSNAAQSTTLFGLSGLISMFAIWLSLVA